MEEMKPVIKQFEKELGQLVSYVIDNFREGDALKFNSFKTKSTKDREQSMKL